MEQSRRDFVKTGALAIAATSLASSLASVAAQDEDTSSLGGNEMRGPIYNQDDSEFCYVRTPDQVSGEAVDAWVDEVAKAGVGTLITCVCAMTANYASKAWETRWARYDPEGPDDQPVLRHVPAESIPQTRRWIEGEKKLADLGINFHERAFARCKKHGMGAWASIRMNDLHDCDLPDTPLLSTFYMKQRDAGLTRVPYNLAGWRERALDYGRQDVRDHFMKLVREVLTFEGIEGLELDWMRFGYHFRPGRELEGGEILTQWIREVRELCNETGKLHGHRVRLGVRVPSTPETARNLGMDGLRWAREGLIDLLVPTPFWATCEFNMPIRTWRRLLDGTGVTLAGGLEVRYEPYPGAAAEMMSARLATGAAAAVLQGGADAVYLFNYFGAGHGLSAAWGPETYNETIAATGSLDDLAKLPRTHAVTYRDVLAPGEPAGNALPANGRWCSFRLDTGPKPVGRGVKALLEIRDLAPDAPSLPLRVNGEPCPEAENDGKGVLTYTIPEQALTAEAHVFEVDNPSGAEIIRVEFVVL